MPAITGPHMENFAGVCELMSAAGALIQLQDPARLGACLSQLLADPGRCRRMGAAGERVMAENRGAGARQLSLVARHLAPAP